MTDDKDDERPTSMTSMAGAGTFLLAYQPEDPELLAAVGALAIRHAHLDHALIGAIKTLAGLSMPDANQRYGSRGSEQLRLEVHRVARLALGEGDELLKMEDFLGRCESASHRRNRFMHAIWYKDHYTDELGLFYRMQEGPVPTAQEVLDLKAEVEALASEIWRARTSGYIANAMLTAARGIGQAR